MCVCTLYNYMHTHSSMCVHKIHTGEREREREWKRINLLNSRSLKVYGRERDMECYRNSQQSVVINSIIWELEPQIWIFLMRMVWKAPREYVTISRPRGRKEQREKLLLLQRLHGKEFFREWQESESYKVNRLKVQRVYW